MEDNMEFGDTFRVAGYDIVASAKFCIEPGETLVLCNNSTHYIVAVRLNETDEIATFHASYQYHDDDSSLMLAYRFALRRMALISASR